MKSSSSRSGETNLDECAAERRVVDADRTAIQLGQLAHDRQADALTADALVEAGATVQHAGALVRGNPRAVVLDDQAQAIAARGAVGDALRCHPHLAATPLECVVQQVACD